MTENISLKYQSYIDDMELDIQCPHSISEIENEMQVYRWVFDPIENSNNFLPNIVFDKLNNPDLDYSTMESEKKCLRCGASFYQTLNQAKTIFLSINNRLRGIKKLKYTHIAVGVLNKGDGVIRNENNGHLGFYEHSECNLISKFKIVSSLVE